MLTKILFFVKDFLNNYDFVGEKNFLYSRFGILRRFGGFGLICELFNEGAFLKKGHIDKF